MALSGASTVRSPVSPDHRRWLTWGDHIAVWPGRRLVRVGRRIATLTRGEFALLETLAHEDGEPVSRAELVRAIRRGSTAPTSRTVDTHIHTLRRKLGDDSRDPRLIVTVSGVGYALGS